MRRGRERLDQPAVVPVVERPRPGEARDLAPRPFGRPPLVADPVGGVDETGPVVPGDAVEEDRLPAGVGQQVRRLGHLGQGRPRAAHRHEDPVDSRLAHDSRLGDVLRIVAIDRRQGDDRADPLAREDPPERTRTLPGPAHEPPGIDDGHPLLEQVVLDRRDAEAQHRRGTTDAHEDRPAAIHAWLPLWRCSRPPFGLETRFSLRSRVSGWGLCQVLPLRSFVGQAGRLANDPPATGRMHHGRRKARGL